MSDKTALTAISFFSPEERDLVIRTLRALRDRDADGATHEGRVLAKSHGFLYMGELSSLGELVIGIADTFGVDALERIAAGPVKTPKFCAHCKDRRSFEAEVHALAATARTALSEHASSTERELAQSLALNGLVDLLDDGDEGKAAAE